MSARLPLRVPVMIGDGERSGSELISTDPGDPERVVAVAAVAGHGRRGGRRGGGRARARGVARGRRGGPRRARSSGAGRAGRASGGSSSRRPRSAKPRQAAAPRPTSTCPRGLIDFLQQLTLAAPSRSNAALNCSRSQASATRCDESRARGRCGDVCGIFPVAHPRRRMIRGRARERQRRSVRAGPAASRLRGSCSCRRSAPGARLALGCSGCVLPVRKTSAWCWYLILFSRPSCSPCSAPGRTRDQLRAALSVVLGQAPY